MKSLSRFAGFTAIALLLLQCWPACAQDTNRNLGSGQKTSPSGLTGAAAGGSSAAAKAERADGLGNPLLGGVRHPLYRLRPSDVVNISFTIAPEFNQTLTVQPDGYVTLKDAGMVEVEGLDLEEFQNAVQRAYRGYLHDPAVAVALKDFAHPYFVVGGQVTRPGKYELRSDTTLAEAVQIAGGMTAAAKSSQVVLFRRVGDDLVEAHLLDLKKMLKQHRLVEDAHLQAGDLVFVPQNAISKIAPFLTKPSMGMYVSPTEF